MTQIEKDRAFLQGKSDGTGNHGVKLNVEPLGENLWLLFKYTTVSISKQQFVRHGKAYRYDSIESLFNAILNIESWEVYLKDREVAR